MTGELGVGFKKDEETYPNFKEFFKSDFFIVSSFCQTYNLTAWF